MNTPFRALAAATLVACAALPAWSAVDVGVGVTIREPGVYGRIEIGTAPILGSILGEQNTYGALAEPVDAQHPYGAGHRATAVVK